MFQLSRRQAFQTSAAALLSTLALKNASAQNASSADDALSIMKADPRFSDWVEILDFAGLEQYAGNDPPYTAFVPTNEAFAKVPDVLADVTRSKSRAFPDTTIQVGFVRSHIIRDIHPLTEFKGKITTLTSVDGNPIKIDGSKPGVFKVSWVSLDKMGTAHIRDSPIQASNAIIYPFDDLVRV